MAHMKDCWAFGCGTAIAVTEGSDLTVDGGGAVNCGTFIEVLPSQDDSSAFREKAVDINPRLRRDLLNGSVARVGYSKDYAVALSSVKWPTDIRNSGMKVTNNSVANVDTFFRGPDNPNTIIDGNHFVGGRIFLDVTSADGSGSSIAVPEGMTSEDMKELVKIAAKAKLEGKDLEGEVSKSPWWPKLLENGANATTLIGAMVSSAIALIG